MTNVAHVNGDCAITTTANIVTSTSKLRHWLQLAFGKAVSRVRQIPVFGTRHQSSLSADITNRWYFSDFHHWYCFSTYRHCVMYNATGRSDIINGHMTGKDTPHNVACTTVNNAAKDVMSAVILQEFSCHSMLETVDCTQLWLPSQM